jgi:hypothetical protein
MSATGRGVATVLDGKSRGPLVRELKHVGFTVRHERAADVTALEGSVVLLERAAVPSDSTAAAALGARIGGLARRGGVGRIVLTSSLSVLRCAPLGCPADERDVPPWVPAGDGLRPALCTTERALREAAGSAVDVITLYAGEVLEDGDTALLPVIDAARSGRLIQWVDGLLHVLSRDDLAIAQARAAAVMEPRPRYCLPGRPRRLSVLLEDSPALPPPLPAADAVEKLTKAPWTPDLVDFVLRGQPVSCRLAHEQLGIKVVDGLA